MCTYLDEKIQIVYVSREYSLYNKQLWVQNQIYTYVISTKYWQTNQFAFILYVSVKIIVIATDRQTTKC